jgi:hypothetical protein
MTIATMTKPTLRRPSSAPNDNPSRPKEPDPERRSLLATSTTRTRRLTVALELIAAKIDVASLGNFNPHEVAHGLLGIASRADLKRTMRGDRSTTRAGSAVNLGFVKVA